ncbi:MAG: PA2169 family four-helix-bundle protein [Bacteroidota bacterium]
MADHNKAVEHLNDLLEKTYDAEAGYKKAAEEVEVPQLVNFFETKAKQRYDFGHEIKAEIKSLGGTPDKGGSVKGNLHRTWMNVKSALSLNDTEAILEECERGEEASLKEYDEALADQSLPTSTRTLLQKQRTRIVEALTSIDVKEEVYDD